MTRDSCVSRRWSAIRRWVWPASMNPPRATTSTDACSSWSMLGEVSLSNWKSSVGSCTGLAFRRTGSCVQRPAPPHDSPPARPSARGGRSAIGSGADLGDRLEDALRRDAVCRADRLREERDPQLLDHPADVDDVGGAALGRAAASRAGRRSGPRRGRPARAPGRRGRGWRAPCRAGARWRGGSGRGRAAGAGPVSATKPGRTSSRSWARTSASIGRIAGLLDRSSSASRFVRARCLARIGSTRPTTCTTLAVVWVRTAESAHSKSSRVRTVWSRSPVGDGVVADRVDGRGEAVVEQGRDAAVRVVAERELLGVGQAGEDLLPRRGDAEQEQPPHAEAVLGVGLGPGRQHPQVDGRAGVDERREALHARARSRTTRRTPSSGNGGEAGALDPGPGAAHLPAQLRRGGVADGLEVLAGGDGPTVRRRRR